VQRITPYLSYGDARSAIEWLCNAFGFEEVLRYVEPDGTLSHAELALCGASVFLSQSDPLSLLPHRCGGQTVHVLVDDVNAHCARARRAGARIVSDLEETPVGLRRYRVDDFEGHRWIFAQRIREVAPHEWGALTPRRSDGVNHT
jgi:uncharacterized glyoxalase superfamily protein PhnB